MKLTLIKINLIHQNNDKGVNPDKTITFYLGKKPAKILKKNPIQKEAYRELKVLSTLGYGVQDATNKNILFEYFGISIEVINKVQSI